MEQRLKLKELIKIQRQIDKNGGPQESGEHFEEYHDLRSDILESYGLLNSDQFGQFFFVQSAPIDIETITDRLENAAIAYLLLPVKSETQTLVDAITLKLDSAQVLPELGITSHVYTIFVYEEILLSRCDSPISVLEALRLVEQDPEALTLLGVLSFEDNIEKQMIMLQQLEDKGIKYLDKYLYDIIQKTIL